MLNVIKCTKINLSEKVLSSSIGTIANGKAVDKLCLNKQWSLKTTTTWPISYCFSYFFGDRIFVVCSGDREYSSFKA